MKLQRWLIIPTALIVLTGLSYFRTPFYRAPVVGDIEIYTEASELGFVGGDLIEKLDEKEVKSWEDFVRGMADKRGELLTVQLRRKSEAKVLKVLVPKSGRILGLDHQSKVPVLTLRSESPLKAYGIENGDRLVRVGGQEIHFWRDMAGALAAQENNKPLALEIRKSDGKMQSISIPSGTAAYSVETLGIENPLFFVLGVKKRSLAERLGLEMYDRLLTLQREPLTADFHLSHLQESMATEKILEVEVLRGSEIKTLRAEVAPVNTQIEGGLSDLHHFLGIDYSSVEIPAPNLNKKDFSYWISVF